MRYNVMNLVKGHLINYPCPININFLWNYGFLLGIVFFIQILTGVLLATCYTPEVSFAYYSIQHILRELWNGWCFRYLHSTGSSFVFILTYLHILKGLNYSFCYLPMSWITGLIIYIMIIVTSFMGYVLPWGQMSFWGATVITNLLYFIPGLVDWICGGFLISDPTLKRFFVLHFIFPFIALIVVIIHIFFLHLHGSTNPLGYDTALKIPFYPSLLTLDIKGFNYVLVLFIAQSYLGFIPLSHPDNALEVDILVTPQHIVPEWYFLSFYTMIKTIPNKTSGLFTMMSALLILFLLGERRSLTSLISLKFRYGCRDYSLAVIWFICSFYALMYIGYQLPIDEYIIYGRIFIIFFFVCVLFMLASPRKYHYDYSSQANIIFTRLWWDNISEY